MPPKNAQGNMSSIDTVSLKFYVVSRQLNQTFDELVVTKLSAWGTYIPMVPTTLATITETLAGV